MYVIILTVYYQKNKERLETKAHERHQNFSEKQKNKKSQYARKQYRNLSEEKSEKPNMVVNKIEIFQKKKNKG